MGNNDDREVLIDQIITPDIKNAIKHASFETKDRLAKESIHAQVCEFMDDLNKQFDNVTFQSKWGYKCCRNTSDGHELINDLYDYDVSDDGDRWSLDIDEDMRCKYFMDADFNTMCLTLYYFWYRRCSLGCQHRTQRFRIISMPTLLTMLSYHRLGKPIKEIIAEYLDDFFFDPLNAPRKVGRPRKQPHSSCKP